MLRVLAVFVSMAVAPASALADRSELAGKPCSVESHGGALYTACGLDLEQYELSLHWKDSKGEVIGQPLLLEEQLIDEGREMAVATNGGMYHADRSPVGLFVADRVEQRPLVRGEGPGNFQLLPNGVFFVEDGVAGVSETEAYASAAHAPQIATQSGPLLVLDGELHPAFREGSDSVYRRAGVGVSLDGTKVWIVVSAGPVNFYTFALFFRDHLGVDDALYLDGKVARIDVPSLDHREFGLSMGPILAASQRLPNDELAGEAPD